MKMQLDYLIKTRGRKIVGSGEKECLGEGKLQKTKRKDKVTN